MTRRPLILVAAGGLAREVVAALAITGDRKVVGLLDDQPGLHGTLVAGVEVLGPIAAAAEHPRADLLVCAGRGRVRSAIVDRLAKLGITPDRYATLIDPAARVGAGSVVGPGSIMLAGTVLTAGVTVGAHVVCMPNVTLTHDDVVEDFATLCAGVAVGGSARIGALAYVGMNAGIRENVRVGLRATIGMGAAVLGDVPDDQTWVGVPARPLTVEAHR